MKESERIHRKRTILNAFLWGAAALSVACMIGVLVTLVLLGVKISIGFVLLASLCGGFLGGALVFGTLGLFLFRCEDKTAIQELDALEREDDEHSFHVGEGTLATLQDDALVIHGGAEKRPISVPYFDLKFYSVCTRKTPREKGTWSVLIEIPAHYLNKREEYGMKPFLIQADGKERLYQRLKELGIELLGEQPVSEQKSKEKFTLMRKFVQADESRRKKIIFLMVFSLILIVWGIVMMLLLRERMRQASTFGSIVMILGCYLGFRTVFAYVKAKIIFSVYREGVFFHSSGVETAFLKWEELVSVEKIEREDGSVLRAECLYGKYDFPLFEGAYEYIAENFPEKIWQNEEK